MIKEQGIDSFHLLEEYVPMEEQMEFFHKSEISRINVATFDKEEEVVKLFSPYEDKERKQESLLRLSSIADVDAYRTIEAFHKMSYNHELHNWATMALLNSKIVLSSTLSGQQQVYISSGLGGLNKRLRFFGLFASSDREPFTELQSKMIYREFLFQLSQNNIVIEKIDINENYFTILILFSIDEDARVTINSTIEEINKYGNFLDTKYLFTNTRVLDDDEIQKYLNKGKHIDIDMDMDMDLEL